MDLNTGALSSGGYINEAPDTLGSLAKGAALGADLQNIADKQEDAKKKRMVVSNLPSLMGRIKENQSDFDAVAQVAQYAPGMIDYINAANKQDAEAAEKRKAELVSNLATGYAFIESAEDRGMTKEEAWDHFINYNKANDIDLGDIANQKYSDYAAQRLKTMAYGVKALAEQPAGFSKNLQIAKDSSGNLVYVQASEAGGAQVVPGLTPAETLMSVGTGSGTELVGSKTGKTGRTIAKVLSAAEAADLDPSVQARLVAAKEAAKREAEANADKATGEAGIDQTVDLAYQLKELAKGGYYGSTAQDRARYSAAKNTGIGADDARYLNTAAMEPLVTNLLVMSKPKGMGAMTDAEWTMLKRGVADPAQYATPQAYLGALDKFINIVRGRSKTGQKNSSAPKPSAKFLGFE